ncbi:hypothetical protein TTHN1_01736 [Thermus thermophilus]|uniref:Uncharacterized protein n=1 Tax=Thermus thermophilus TaxID=274 RepID=A0A3P4AS32_THETH|nr:hypothetical protein TTHN1_01736 [Thermus thermophilus]
MAESPIGVVVSSRRNGPWAELTLVLTPQELDQGKRLLLANSFAFLLAGKTTWAWF